MHVSVLSPNSSVYQASLLEVPGKGYWALTPSTGTVGSEMPRIVASAQDEDDAGGSDATAGGSGSDSGAESTDDGHSGSVTTNHDSAMRGKKRFRDGGGEGDGNVKASSVELHAAPFGVLLWLV